MTRKGRYTAMASNKASRLGEEYASSPPGRTASNDNSSPLTGAPQDMEVSQAHRSSKQHTTSLTLILELVWTRSMRSW